MSRYIFGRNEIDVNLTYSHFVLHCATTCVNKGKGTLMASPSHTRTIRFSEQDIRDIERFLKENQIFDFSTLARVAIRRFIENPNIEIKGLRELEGHRPKRRQEVNQ